MLKGIRAELNGAILETLSTMGHGDFLVVADANFPSDAIARQTRIGKLLTMDNIPAPRAIDAILSVFPLDTPVQPSVGRMEVMGKPDEIPGVQAEVQAIVDRVEGRPSPMYGVERMAFYEVAKKAYCVIATGELRFYGCFLLTKGVIPAEDVVR